MRFTVGVIAGALLFSGQLSPALASLQKGRRIDHHDMAMNRRAQIDPAYTSPLVLPAQPISGAGGWEDSLVKARKFVKQLTIPELVNLTTGTGAKARCAGMTGRVTRFDFPALCLEDTGLGPSLVDGVSSFPAGINIAATFDTALMLKRAQAIGAEFRGKGVNVALGPMMNLARLPEAGRNWEGFGADPFLSGVAAANTVTGIQQQGVIATAKHFAANEQEHYRGGGSGIGSSSNVNDKNLHEQYLWPFAESVRAGVGSVMCSYNRINQTYACENSKLLNGILKEELNFQGFVVSDWTAMQSGIASALAGTDMDMPGFIDYSYADEPDPSKAKHSYWGAALTASIQNGSVPLARVQDMVTRTVAAWYQLGQDKNYPEVNFNQGNRNTLNEHVNVQGNHASLIRTIAAASNVLLKNTGNILPLDLSAKRWTIFGDDSVPNTNPNACPYRSCDNGTLAVGWGSGSNDFPSISSPAGVIKSRVLAANKKAVVTVYNKDAASPAMLGAAKKSDVCLVFANSDSGEGFLTVEGNEGDRNTLELWHNTATLITKIAARCPNTIVVIHTVGAVDMEAFADLPSVKGIILAGLPGQEAGNGIADLLFGDVNPSGRLPYTIGKLRSDYPADVLYSSNQTVPQIEYSEEGLIDYRWFDAKKITPRYEFGFGLSYTTFSYSGLSIAKLAISTDRKVAPGGEQRLYTNAVTVKFKVKNTGKVAGAEIAQLYLTFPDSADMPPQVLRGFRKVQLNPGRTAKVSINLRVKDISYWDVVTQNWIVPTGTFSVGIKQSSRISKLVGTFTQ